MKIRLIKFLMLGVIISILTGNLMANNFVHIFVDGEQIPLTNSTGRPMITNSTTLVPMRVVSEYLNYEVEWDAQNKIVTITGDDTTIKLTVGNKIAYVNGQAQTLLVAPTIHNNRTYVPFRFVGETFGYEVKWDATTYSVIFRSKGYTGPDMVEVPAQSAKIQDVLVLNSYMQEYSKLYGDKDKNMYVTNGSLEEGANIKAIDGARSNVCIQDIDWYLKDLLVVTATSTTSASRGILFIGVQDGKVVGVPAQSDFVDTLDNGKVQFIFQDFGSVSSIKNCDQLLFFGDDGVAVLVSNPLYEGR